MIKKIVLVNIIISITLLACTNKLDFPKLFNNEISGGNEKYPGGEGTVSDFSHLAFNKRLKTLTATERGQFSLGNSFFDKPWVVAPASAKVRDGLGPFLNASSCGSCHRQDGRGRPPLFDGELSKGLLLRLSIPGTAEHGGPLGDPNYGDQLQDRSIPGVPSEGKYTITHENIKGYFADGTAYELAKPNYNIHSLNYGELSPDIMVSPRVAPQMIGLGLLEAIEESAILAYADEFDENNDGISGRPNYVWDKENKKIALGRFGWKANEPSLRQQSADAFKGDVGITSSINPEQNCISGDCEDVPSGANKYGVELSDYFLDRMETYTRSLSPPYRPKSGDKKVLSGKKIFDGLQCNACHIEKHRTGPHKMAALNEQIIYPYTDLLLHDMGDDLADHRPDFKANGNEWRTPPLWGIGRFKIVSKHTRYLHDGRARNIEEAILWHGGEALKSSENYKSLDKRDRDLLIGFLNSL